VHLDIIKVLLFHQLDAPVICLKNNIKIYIKTAPTYFGVTVTPSSGSTLILGLTKVTVVKIVHYCPTVHTPIKTQYMAATPPPY
jgi:hypothetical protein